MCSVVGLQDATTKLDETVLPAVGAEAEGNFWQDGAARNIYESSLSAAEVSRLLNQNRHVAISIFTAGGDFKWWIAKPEECNEMYVMMRRLVHSVLTQVNEATEGDVLLSSLVEVGDTEQEALSIDAESPAKTLDVRIVLMQKHLVVYSLDASKVRTVERLLASKDLSTKILLGNVNHELKTPLNGLIACLEMLHSSPDLNPANMEMTELAVHSVYSLSRLVNSLLLADTLENAPLLIRKPFSSSVIFNAVDSVNSTFGVKAALKGVEILSTYPLDAEPEQFHGDISRVKHVLTALMDNAIKFTDKKSSSVRISIELGSKVSLGSHEKFREVRIRVQDHGVGMENGHSQDADIFRKYYQVDCSTTRQHGGLGLGLYIVKKLVRTRAHMHTRVRL
jgi:signal transduction histidine kinase